MLRSTHDLENYTIAASDGEVGKIKDFLFDDLAWVIRYFVVETGTWLSSREVLISPIAMQKPNWLDKTLPVSITKEQVKNSPDINSNKPVSRQHEIEYMSYYNYFYYWNGAGLWGGGLYPFLLYPGYDNFPYAKKGTHSAPLTQKSATNGDTQKEDTNLRSCNAVIGYHIHAKDGSIGHVSGALIEESTWALRYLIVNTSNWFGGHKVPISPEWIDEVKWLDQSVSVNLNRQIIKDAPNYLTNEQLTHQQEIEVYQHYGLSGYWERTNKSHLETPLKSNKT